MKKIIKAFTLIELVVWITISMMLMVSVGIFVNNWMANILTQQKVIKNTTELTEFTSKVHTTINLIQSWSTFPAQTSSWIIFKRNLNLWEWWFSYIWTINSIDDVNGDWIYCDSGSDSEDKTTKHIILKNFIPFEEEWEDIFNDYTWSLISIKIDWTQIFKSFQKENKVSIKEAWNWKTIIWKWVFWNKLKEWDLWKNIYLNSPTWLAIKWNILFISDTLNNRVLYYKISQDEIYTLLDESDWLNEPTWLFYNDSEKALYIANSWNWEVLKYSSKKQNPIPELTMSWFSENNINKIEVGFSWSNNPSLNTKWNWNITNNFSDDYITYIDNKIINYSINKLTEKNKIECNWKSNWDYIFDTTEITKPIIYCTKSWSWKSLSYPTSTISKIEISSLSNFTNTWTYYANLKLFDWNTQKWDTKNFPFFTQWDDNILTPDDNILEVVEPWLNYPTGLWWDSWNNKIAYNKFWDWNYSNLEYDKNNDTVLKTPIDDLMVNINDDLLSIVLKYYKKYNCYNLDDKSERTYLFNKNLK